MPVLTSVYTGPHLRPQSRRAADGSENWTTSETVDPNKLTRKKSGKQMQPPSRDQNTIRTAGPGWETYLCWTQETVLSSNWIMSNNGQWTVTLLDLGVDEAREGQYRRNRHHRLSAPAVPTHTPTSKEQVPVETLEDCGTEPDDHIQTSWPEQLWHNTRDDYYQPLQSSERANPSAGRVRTSLLIRQKDRDRKVVGWSDQEPECVWRLRIHVSCFVCSQISAPTYTDIYTWGLKCFLCGEWQSSAFSSAQCPPSFVLCQSDIDGHQSARGEVTPSFSFQVSDFSPQIFLSTLYFIYIHVKKRGGLENRCRKSTDWCIINHQNAGNEVSGTQNLIGDWFVYPCPGAAGRVARIFPQWRWILWVWSLWDGQLENTEVMCLM